MITPTKIKGVPDLIVAILSPSNPKYDLVTKRRLYLEAAISEDWIVMPKEHQVWQLAW
jgi:Uma2 family endonuclease